MENHGRYKLLDHLREKNGVFGGTWIVLKKEYLLEYLKAFSFGHKLYCELETDNYCWNIIWPEYQIYVLIN